MAQTTPMKILAVSFAAHLLLPSTMTRAQQQIGIAPVPLGDGPYVFDTAEQHGIRVDVVARNNFV